MQKHKITSEDFRGKRANKEDHKNCKYQGVSLVTKKMSFLMKPKNGLLTQVLKADLMERVSLPSCPTGAPNMSLASG